MTFIPSFKPPKEVPETAMWFLFQEQKLLVKESNKNCSVLQTRDLPASNLYISQRQYLGYLDGKPCYAAELSNSKKVSEPLRFIGIRDIFNLFDADMIHVAGLANQLVLWSQRHLYCGKCGNTTDDKKDERARICHICGSIFYPRLSPAMIVAVVRDNRILLAHSRRFPGKFYSTLAGFVEPGETLEECVEREVREEVGIIVKNIRYFGSQPWPFPDSLMIGFTAEYARGEIKIDNNEIADAGWFSPEDLPPIPPKISIARQLIDWFSKEWGKYQKIDHE